ncbi:GntR family transcriptional regulator [Larsenimonas suaedae]|uniref:GntR family transcriptional regulator n=1 Tax=Larsenimonas suaedae TaxID=1851019 RepID=A0ABU1GVZ0_9GAMM|nr:GntR family transcriptional regulator [Larsenimonas suaedae]MCM2973276.1 GntR family transcriptional regulator [Larsenimonas suaedae]MDR5896169.1 GntR family transcriptional regulator [Larsenimonas suaedae]
MPTSLRTLWNDITEGSVRQRLITVLRDAIIHMTLEPGQALSEKEIADTFDVSRQPVREAFIRLSEAGLVEVRPQRGTFVVPISEAAVLEAQFIREAIEVAVVRACAEHGLSEAMARELDDLLVRQRRCQTTGDSERFYALDEAFHHTLARAAGHNMAWRITQDAKAQLDRVRYLSMPNTTPLDILIDQHTAIIEAITTADIVGAERMMRAHMREILKSLPNVKAHYPALFDDEAQKTFATAGAGHDQENVG